MKIFTPVALTLALALSGCGGEEAASQVPPTERSTQPAGEQPTQLPADPKATPSAGPTETLTVPDVRYYMLDKSCPYCRDIRAWIEGKEGATEKSLNDLYGDRVAFSVRYAYDSQARPMAEAEKFDFGASGHGMVALSPSGDVLFKIDGHNFNRAAAVEAIDGILAAAEKK